MNSKKYLLKNIGFLTMSQFGTKLLSFILVPLYTYVLTTTEYGTYDLNTTTVSLLVPILTLNIADPVLRFPLDRGSDKKGIFSIALQYFLISCLIMTILVFINYQFAFFSLLNEHPILLLLLYIFTALNGIMVNFCRGLDRIKDVAISGVICSAVMILCNILFLIPMHMGLRGFFLANIIGVSAQCIYIFLSTKCRRYISGTYRNKSLKMEMIEYSKPLLINNISWWISSASDRYIVTWLCGVAENGIYSVGYKIPSILNIFQTIFNQAWTLSAVMDFDPEDRDGFFVGVYNAYNFCMVFVCAVLILLSRVMAHLLYSKDFFEAWRYGPFLLIAIIFGALSGYIGGIFAAVKATRSFAQTSIIGAIVNILLNIVLVHYIGAIGAAIATTVCYVLIWILRIIAVRKYMDIRFNLVRDLIAYCILLIQTIMLYLLDDSMVLYSIQLALVLIIVVLFRKEVGLVISATQRKLRR